MRDAGRRSDPRERRRPRGGTAHAVRQPPSCEMEGHRAEERAPRRDRRVGVRGERDPQHRPQRGGRSATRGIQHRAHQLRDDPRRLLRHRRARQGHEPQRRARLDVLPELRAVLRAALLEVEGPRHVDPPAARVQRLAHRRVVRHASRSVHAAEHPPDLGSAGDGRRGASRREEGLPRGHVLREPAQARLAAHLRRPLGPVLPGV